MSDVGANEAAEADDLAIFTTEDAAPDPHSLGLELPSEPDESIQLLLR
jgi:hypothetical protein